VGLIEDEHEGLHCRDCGALVTNAETKRRLLALVYGRPFDPRRKERLERVRNAARLGATDVTLAGACAACGGGRFALRVGKAG
jgi:hypothetical protein